MRGNKEIDVIIMCNKVIVIGGDHHNTLGVIRSLGEKGLRPDLILVSPICTSFVDASKYIEKSWKVENDDEAIRLLLSKYREMDSKPVVICCSDSSSGIIDENREKLCPFFILPGSEKQGKISEMMNKKRIAELAVEVGLNIPKSTYIKK